MKNYYIFDTHQDQLTMSQIKSEAKRFRVWRRALKTMSKKLNEVREKAELNYKKVKYNKLL